MTNQIKQHQTKWAVYFVILQIMLKSPSKVNWGGNPYEWLLMLFSCNTERFNTAYAAFHPRFIETLVD